MKYPIEIRSFGEGAILIEWPKQVSEGVLDDILSFQEYLISSCISVKDWEFVPAYNSLTLVSRNTSFNFKEYKAQIKRWYIKKMEPTKKAAVIWEIPVCYDASFGVDLKETCTKLNLTKQELVSKHTQPIYTVYGIGFLPGFNYLGGLPPELELVRRATPRLGVAKGAVGLAGKQTGIYPQVSPGGWNIIGNCPVSFFNPKTKNPCFVSVGDKVRFYEVSKAAYELLKIENEVGVFTPIKTTINA